MAFLINTGGATVTLTDLGGKVIPASQTNYNLELEFNIEEIRYSDSLAAAIHAGTITSATDDQGRTIEAQASLSLTEELLHKSFHILDTDELPEGTSNLFFTTSRARSSISIATGSTDNLEYNSATGEISIKALTITDVTVDATYTSLASFIATEYTVGDEFQEGDTVVLTAATGGTEIYMHNGGIAGTTADFTLIQQPNVDQATVRTWFDATAPMQYNNTTGVFSMTQASSTVNGWVSSVDWNTFDNKQNAIIDGAALLFAGDTLNVQVDGTSIEVSGDALQVVADGIDDTHIDWGTGVNQVNAADVPLIDTAGNFTTDTVEAALIDLNDRWDSIDNLGDVDTTTSTPNSGDILQWDGANFVPVAKATVVQSFVFSAASTAKKNTDRFLDKQDGLSTNLSPFIMPYAGSITAISLHATVAATWTAIVYINGSASGTALLASGGATKAYTSSLTTAVAAGDEISIYLSGTDINRPSINVWIEEN